MNANRRTPYYIKRPELMIKIPMILLCSTFLIGCQSHEGTASQRPVSNESAQAKLPSPQVAEPSIKGVKLGDTPESFKQKYSNAMCFNDKSSGAITGCLANGVSYATVSGLITVNFQDGKAVLVSVRNLDPSHFSTVTAALVKRMGPSNGDVSKLLKEPPGSLAWGGAKWVFTASPVAFDGNPGVLLMDKAYLVNALKNQANKAEADL